MSDDPGRSHKVRAIRAAIRAAESACPDPPPAGPGRTLDIRQCARCPLREGDYCDAGYFLPYLHEGPRRLDIDSLARIGDPPPGWCPLRAGPVTLEVRP